MLISNQLGQSKSHYISKKEDFPISMIKQTIYIQYSISFDLISISYYVTSLMYVYNNYRLYNIETYISTLQFIFIFCVNPQRR